MAELSLAEGGKGSMRNHEATPAGLRLTLASDRLDRRTRRVLVYDGPPDAGGSVIAYERVMGLDPYGIDVPIPWQPSATGRHDLYLVLPDDPHTKMPSDAALSVDLR